MRGRLLNLKTLMVFVDFTLKWRLEKLHIEHQLLRIFQRLPKLNARVGVLGDIEALSIEPPKDLDKGLDRHASHQQFRRECALKRRAWAEKMGKKLMLPNTADRERIHKVENNSWPFRLLAGLSVAAARIY